MQNATIRDASNALYAEAIARLQAQYEDADDLLITLAGKAVRDDAGPAWWDLSPEQRAIANSAANRALVRVSDWNWAPDHEYGSLARFTIVDAVAAVELEHVFPALADEFASGWATAVTVRDQLRAMGTSAEFTAQRILQHWRLPLNALPTTVQEVLS